MNKLMLKTSLLSATTVLLLSITGCGGGGGGDAAITSSGDTPPTTVSYTGTAVVSGTIDTSSLSAADQSITRSRSRMSRDGETEIVKLYVIDANGEEQDANIDCTIDATGAYECPDVKNGQDFITRYVKDIGNGQVLEMKAPVSVPLTGDPAPVKVDPVTTMVVSAITEAVTKAITGVTSDAALIETILASVTAAITDTMNTLVQAGTITIPSMVIEADFTVIQADEETELLVNDNLGDAVGIVNSSDEVENIVSAVKNEAAADQFAEATSEEQMVAVFKVLGWDEHVPSWVLPLFSGEFNNVQSIDPGTNATSSMTFRKFFTANALVPAIESDLNSTSHFNVLRNFYTDAEIVAMAADVATDINTLLTNGTIFTSMMTEVTNYHTIAAKSIANRTDADMEFIAHFDPTIAQVFPANFVAGATFDTEIDNMAQLMLVLGYLSPERSSIAELVAVKIKAQLDTDGHLYYDTQLNHLGESLFNDDKDSLLSSMFTQATMAKYDEISVGWMNARSENIWDNATATQSSALSFETSLDKVDWDNTIPSEVLGDITATLTYPTLSGTSTTTLTYNSDWGVFATEQVWSMEGIQSTNLITDFVSGDYTVSFTYAGQTYSKTKEFFFIPNAQDYYATLTTPKGQPRYENEWYLYQTSPGDFDPDEATRIEAEIAAFEIASQEYWMNGAPTMAPNTDTTNNDVNDTLTGMIVKWEAPNLDGVTLPENISVAYSLQVNLYEPKITDPATGQNECWTDWDACNTEIYNSWNEDKLITSTSITLPVALKVNENTDDTLYEKSQYSLNVNVLFIDKTTGREVAHGGWNGTQFIVGESVALSGNEVITAKGTVSLNQWEYFDGTQTVTETSALPANFKIAVMADTWAATDQKDDYGYDIWSSTKEIIALGDFNATNNTFEVSTTWGDVEAKLSHNTNIQIIGFSDDNNDSLFQDYDWNNQPTDGTLPVGENSYYINGHMWINTYGDKIINVDTYHDNGEYENNSYRLKTDENVTIEGLDIKIW